MLSDIRLTPFLRLTRIKFGSLFRSQVTTSDKHTSEDNYASPGPSVSGSKSKESRSDRWTCPLSELYGSLAIGSCTAGAVTATRALLDYEHEQSNLVVAYAGRFLFSSLASPVFLPVNAVPVICGSRSALSLPRALTPAPQGSFKILNSETSNSEEDQPASPSKDSAISSAAEEGEPFRRTISTQTSDDSTGTDSLNGKGVEDVRGCLFNMIGLDFAHQHLYSEAVSNFKRAAGLGYAKAQYNLGMCMYKGLGTRKNKRGAVELWEAAAEQKHGHALFQLAALEFERNSSSQKGYDLMRLAEQAGLRQAKEFLEKEK